MSDSLRHRGPDDVGSAILRTRSGSVAGEFAHRRLSVLDLSSAGHQPMYSLDQRLCITYNGEIYNFREIRSKLEQGGTEFRTSSDTEVLLRGWERHGWELLPMLRGMFAFALWDAKEERGFFARDAFGIKPLYIASSEGMILFASEIRALLASGKISRNLSMPAVVTYLGTGSVAEPLTIIEGITAIPPGHVVEIAGDANGAHCLSPRRFAAPLVSAADETERPRSTPADLRNVLRDSVGHHLISDVPVGLFLSGGLDSSIIAAVAAEMSEKPLDSFTVTFDEERYSEAAQARTISQKFGTRHHEIRLTGRELLEALPSAFAAMDQPSLDGLNIFIVSRAVRSHDIKVVLSGLGGDELFAGYPSFRRARQLASFWRQTGWLRHFAAKTVEASDDFRAEQIRLLLDGPTAAMSAYQASRLLFGPLRTAKLMGGRAASMPLEHHTDSDDAALESMSLLQKVSAYELTMYMRNTLLRDGDVFSMAYGLELRVPLVDREVARVAMNVADEVKLKRGTSKPFLFEAMRDLLPEDQLSRPKRGFTLPFERWMRNELREEIDAVFNGDSSTSVGLDPFDVRRSWGQFQTRRNGMNWSRPWALYTLIRWAQQNEVAFKPAVASLTMGSRLVTAAG